MTQGQWREIWAQFQRVRETPEAQRAQVLEVLEPQIREEVLAMLAEEEAEAAHSTNPEPGQKYDKYTLVTRLGAGGMGEVYSARDEVLGRLVAIKFVGAKARMMPSAMQRLIAEAQSASALNHPNLVTVHEVLRLDGGFALVTEFVDGKALREFCGQPRDIREVAGWGLQIARALAVAHAASIVHGDIKPENIMLRHEGLIKVLDFGLASRTGAATDDLAPALGTVGYMSPEQTRGEALTGASDVFSLGIVLYELSSGRHPFLESTSEATTQAISGRELDFATPDLPDLPEGRRFSQLLRGMLQKHPDQRPSMQEVAAALDRVARPGLREHLRDHWRWLAAALAAPAALLLAWFLWGDRGVQTLPSFTEPVAATKYSGIEKQPALSPDGRWLLFVWSGADGAQDDLYLRATDAVEDLPVRVTNDPQVDFTPVWSPDGQWIAWQRRALDGGPAALFIAPFSDGSVGEPRQIASVADHEGYFGLAWWPDSQALVTRDVGPKAHSLVKVNVADGSKSILTTPTTGGDFQPTLAPDGKTMAFLRSAGGEHSICVLDVATQNLQSCRAVPFAVIGFAWSPDGDSLLYSGNGALWQLGLTTDRPAIRLRDGDFTGLSQSGNQLLFSRILIDTNIWSLDVKTGESVQWIASSDEESEPQFSPDGQQILFRSNRSGSYQIYVCARDGSNVRRLTSLGGHVGSARWSPDGNWIAFDAGRSLEADRRTAHENVYVMPARGGEPRRLTDDREDAVVPGWSSDSRWLYFVRGVQPATWRISIDGGAPERVGEHEFWDVQESRDGDWLWFEWPSASKGLWRRSTRDGAEMRVAGAEDAVYRTWDIAGDVLFFLRRGDEPGFVRLQGTSARWIGPPPKRLLRGPRTMAVSPEGQQILYTAEDVTVGDIYKMDVLAER